MILLYFQDTKLIAQDDKCQITSAPKDIVPEDLETRGDQIQKSSGVITADQETVKYSAKLFVKEATENDKVNLTTTMTSKCVGKPIEIVKEIDVSESLFMQLDSGAFVDGSSLGEGSRKRIKRETGCTNTRVMGQERIF